MITILAYAGFTALIIVLALIVWASMEPKKVNPEPICFACKRRIACLQRLGFGNEVR